MDIYGRRTGGIESGVYGARSGDDKVELFVCAGCACYAPQIEVVAGGERHGRTLNAVEQGLPQDELTQLLMREYTYPVEVHAYDCDSCRDGYDADERAAGY